MQDAQVGLTVALVSLAYVYFGLYIWYVYGAYTALRAEPYSKYKCAALRACTPLPPLVPALPIFCTESGLRATMMGAVHGAIDYECCGSP